MSSRRTKTGGQDCGPRSKSSSSIQSGRGVSRKKAKNKKKQKKGEVTSCQNR